VALHSPVADKVSLHRFVGGLSGDAGLILARRPPAQEVRLRPTCYRVSGAFADLVRADLPGGSYRDQHGHHRLLIRTITAPPPNDRHLPAPSVPSSDERPVTAHPSEQWE
jgi:hypothetical protein